MKNSDKQPFFSILMPTRNRSHIIGQAIESALCQTEGDFEIVVSDNDESEILTRDAISKFKDDRIKYHRTNGDLSMADNWENAYRHTSGKYVLVLEDKQVLYPHALAKVKKVIEEKNAQVVTWFNSILDDSVIPSVFYPNSGDGSVLEEESCDILKRFCDNIKFHSYAPRFINSCASKELIELAVSKTSFKRLFIPVSPDICAGFIILNVASNVYHVNEALAITGSIKHSNGRAFEKRSGKNYVEFMSKVADECDPYQYAAMRLQIKSSFFLNDFRRVKNSVDECNLKSLDVSEHRHFSISLKEIVERKMKGLNSDGDLKDWFQFYKKIPIVSKLMVVFDVLGFLARGTGSRVYRFILSSVNSGKKNCYQIDIDSPLDLVRRKGANFD